MRPPLMLSEHTKTFQTLQITGDQPGPDINAVADIWNHDARNQLICALLRFLHGQSETGHHQRPPVGSAGHKLPVLEAHFTIVDIPQVLWRERRIEYDGQSHRHLHVRSSVRKWWSAHDDSRRKSGSGCEG